MTTEPLRRRSLLPVRPQPPADLNEVEIANIANRHGFQAASPAPVTETVGAQRRHRQPTGRDHQFTTRLRRETIDFIYAQANGRNVPIAQVIEDMAEALKREHGA